jgi:BASS family bile acid:Na+ symporter
LLATQIVDIAISAVLGLVMFGVGLSLSISDFFRIIRYPRAFFTALTVQMLGLPLIAFAIQGLLSPLPPEIKVGFIILAASPGGATSGFLAYLWRANVALSLSITSVNSFLTLISIPIVTNLGLKFFLGRTTEFHLPLWETMGHIFAIAILPALLGIFTRSQFPRWSEKISRPAKYAMMVLLAIVFIIKLTVGENQGGAGLDLQDFIQITPFALIQNLACLFTGYFMMRLMGMDHASRLTAAMESGVQNTTLAFLIASSFLHNQEMVKPALVYSLYSFWTACLFAYFSNRISGSNARLPAQD